MNITARCHPKLEPLLPKPSLASRALPDWLKHMPSTATSQTLGGEDVRTLKHCLPFIDAMSSGVLVPLAADVSIHNGELSWDWDPPILEDASISRSPIGVHVPEQASGFPDADQNRLIIKFMNFWTLEVPQGWRLLFCHPLNRSDLPFRTFSGVVDCHHFRDGYVHFPAALDPDFEGEIDAGTPIAQVIPVPAEETTIQTAPMTPAQVEANRQIQLALQEEPGVYRKQFRR